MVFCSFFLGTLGPADAFVFRVIHDPFQIVGDPGVHSRIVFPGAPLTPRHYAYKNINIYYNYNNNILIITLLFKLPHLTNSIEGCNDLDAQCAAECETDTERLHVNRDRRVKGQRRDPENVGRADLKKSPREKRKPPRSGRVYLEIEIDGR